MGYPFPRRIRGINEGSSDDVFMHGGLLQKVTQRCSFLERCSQ